MDSPFVAGDEVVVGCFNIPQPVVNKWTHVLHPCVNRALALANELPARQSDQVVFPERPQPVFFQNGVERPIQRPKDKEAQRTYYSGKKKRHMVKNNVVVNKQAKICLLTPTYERKKPDKKVSDETDIRLPEGSILYQDTGFQGFAGKRGRACHHLTAGSPGSASENLPAAALLATRRPTPTASGCNIL